MVESGKNIFQSYFWKCGAVKEFLGLMIFPIKQRGGGRVSRHPRYGKAEVLTLGNLYVTCDFNSSSPVTVSLL